MQNYHDLERARNLRKHNKNGGNKKNNKKDIDQPENLELQEFSHEPQCHLITQIHCELRDQLKGHFKLGIWRKDLNNLTRTHLAPFGKLLKMNQFDNSTLIPVTASVHTKKKTAKNEILVQFPNVKRSCIVKVGQFPIFLSLQDLCFYKLTLREFIDRFSSTGHEEQDLTAIFTALKANYITNRQDEFVLWPAAILDPLNFEFETAIQFLSNFSIAQQQSIKLLSSVKDRIDSIKEPQDQDQHQMGIEVEQEINALKMPQPQIIQQNSVQSMQLPSNIIQPIQPQTTDYNTIINYSKIVTEKHFCLWLIGTSIYFPINTNLVPWGEVSNEMKLRMFEPQGIPELLAPVNQVIKAMNRYKLLSHVPLKQEDWRLFLYRMGRYSGEQGQQAMECIPFRFGNLKNSGKSVLIRILKSESTELKWVSIENVHINYQMPTLKKQELQLLYLVTEISPLNIVSKYFYRELYSLPECELPLIFQLYYPKRTVTRQQIYSTRCSQCYYIIRDMPFRHCSICNKFCHEECVTNLGKINQISKLLSDDQQNIDEYWVCEGCQPCALCCQAVGLNYLKCNICENYLHELCGKLKGLEEGDKILDVQNRDKYICQACLKCRMCSCKLKDHEYVLVSDDFFCSDCYEKIVNNENCHICMKKRESAWTQCDQPECGKWIHHRCDPEYYWEIPQPVESQKYLCPFCRQKEIRAVFVRIIEAVSVFDELQYFTEPSYDRIPNYQTIISKPMCFNRMKEKALSGAYDQKPYQLIAQDFKLIVSNALQFNMPKQSPHFQAKVLQIMGEMALQKFQPLFTPNIKAIVTQKIFDKIVSARYQLHQYINDHYPQILINYQSQKSYIEVKKKGLSQNIAPTNQLIFHSPFILNTLFKSSSVIFHLKKQKVRIQSLFTMPKNENDRGSWLPLRNSLCYYHNSPNIIFSCDDCCESYCCLTSCFKHRLCTCGMKGCRCDSFECGCTPMKQKDRKFAQYKLHLKYFNPNVHKTLRDFYMDITENYKYCLKCVRDNVVQRQCLYCHLVCSENYSKCRKCEKMWHNRCSQQSHINDYPLLCRSCQSDQHNLNTAQQCLILKTKCNLIKIQKIQKYMRVFIDIYFIKGIRLTVPEIERLILSNYDQFSMREKIFNLCNMNYDVISRSHENDHSKLAWIEESVSSYVHELLKSKGDRIEIEMGSRLDYNGSYLWRVRDIWWGMMGRAQQFLRYIQDGGSEQCQKPGQHILDLQKSRKYSLYRTFVSGLDLRGNDGYSIHTDWQISQISTSIGIHQLSTYLYYQSDPFSIDLDQANFFNEISIRKIRNNIIDQVDGCLTLYDYTRNKIQNAQNLRNLFNETDTQPLTQFHSQSFTSQKQYKSYISSLKYISTVEQSYLMSIQPYRHRIVYTPRPIPHRYLYNSVFRKKDQMRNQLTSFLLRIYEQDKKCLRRGSTCIIKNTINNSKKFQWCVIKKWDHNKQVMIQLAKKNNVWILQIDKLEKIVGDISDIIEIINTEVGTKIQNFKDLGEFLGFTIYQPFYKANHFTVFLQTNLVDEMPLLTRMKSVTQLYDSFEWGQNGFMYKMGPPLDSNFQTENNQMQNHQQPNNMIRYEYNMTKVQPYYLQKRKKRVQPSNKSKKQEQSVKKAPFITFEDLKKHLQLFSHTHNKQDVGSLKNAAISNSVFIAPSKIHKLGLFSRCNLKKGSVVIEYVGEIISESVADLREQQFHYGCYMFGLGKQALEKKDIIDATFRGNMARYLNHSCDPNCKAKTQHINGWPRIFIYTIRDVQQYEEITYDYQFTVDLDDKLECTCGAKNCQGRLN